MACGLLSSKTLAEQSLKQKQYEVYTEVRLAIDALDYEYNHDARTQSPRLSAASLQLAVGRHGLGPIDQEEQHAQRASFVATYNTRAHTAAAGGGGHTAGLGFLVENLPRETPRHVSTRPD